jgi:hypothetical protein
MQSNADTSWTLPSAHQDCTVSLNSSDSCEFWKILKLRTLELELLPLHRLASSQAELTCREAPSSTDAVVRCEAEARGTPRWTHDAAEEPWPCSAITHPSLVVAEPQRSPLVRTPRPPLCFEPFLTMPRSPGRKDNIAGEQHLGRRRFIPLCHHSPCRQRSTVHVIVDDQD